MKNKDLMKAVGDIDDRYIEEAAGSAKKAVEKKSGKVSSFIKSGRWTKWAGAVAALLVLALVAHVIFPGGSKWSNAKSDDGAYYYNSDYADYDASPSYMAQDGYSYSSNRKNSYNSGSAGGSVDYAEQEAPQPSQDTNSNTVYNPSNVKLIYRADVKAQTTDFAEADAALREMVTGMGGYFESQSISNGNYYNGDYLKKASYIVRVPADRFEDFLSGVKEGVTVKSLSQTAEDVGLQYSETEQKIETLKIKLGRLQDLLRQATNMSDIIELEYAISDTEENIDYYTKTLNRYDSLIGFSTINIELTEVARPGSGIEEKEGFFKKLGRRFVEGLGNAGENLADIFYWISYNFIGILIFAAIVFCLIKFRPFTKLFRKISKKEQK